EVAVVDDRGEGLRRRAVGAPERDAVEALPEIRRRLAVPIGSLARTHGPLVPSEPEPDEVAEDRLLPTGHVAGRVGVVDPKQHPVAERALPYRAPRVTDLEDARSA